MALDLSQGSDGLKSNLTRSDISSVQVILVPPSNICSSPLFQSRKRDSLKEFAGGFDGPETNSSLVRYLSTKKSAENQQEQSFTVSYLVNSLGFFPKSAISASKRVHFTTPDKPDLVLALLREHGFGNTHISKIISKYPELLVSKPEITLIPKLDFFGSLGFSEKEVVELFSSKPHICRRSLNNMIIPHVDFLKSMLVTDSEVATSLKRGAMNFTHDVQKYMRPNVEVLRLAGVPDRMISFALQYEPDVLNQSNDHFSAGVKEVIELGVKPSGVAFLRALTVVIKMSKSKRERKVEAFKRWGCSDTEISAAFRSHPGCMLTSEKKIMSGMEYFVNKMGLKPSNLTRNPRLLDWNLEKKTIPRCSVVRCLQLKGLLKKKLSLYTILRLTEKQFLDKFVIKYKEQVPQLFRVYEGKVGLLELGYGPEDICRMAQSGVYQFTCQKGSNLAIP